MVKAAFFDIDGTLYSHRTHTIPASAQEALQRLHQSGIRIFLATGRSRNVFEEVPVLNELPIDGAVTLNGAYCFDRDGLIHHDPIHPDAIAALMAWLEVYPSPCGFIEGERSYVNFYNDRVHAVHTAIRTPLLPIGDLSRGLTHPIYQILLYLDTECRLPLPTLPHTRSARWHTGGLDIFPITAGKSNGVQKVLAHYGIHPEEAIAFGDAENDLDMFSVVGHAVAMGNGSPEIKAAAEFVTTDVDADGIYNALHHYGLI